jgi:hypothetical protein
MLISFELWITHTQSEKAGEDGLRKEISGNESNVKETKEKAH